MKRLPMAKEKHRVIQDPDYGYRRLDPIPYDEEIAEFYQSQYYDLIRKGGRAPEIRRLMAGGQEADRERSWLRATFYSDILHVLNQYSPGARVLDVGCGTGELIWYLKENGFETFGLEPSADAVAIARSRGLTVYDSNLEDFVQYCGTNNIEPFDAVTFVNVFEHVTAPVDLIALTKKILRPAGVLCVKVPNDFSELQLAAQRQISKEAWWIASPDHINYFNFQSLGALLERLGFEVIYSQGDFPMEFFLLMGDDYIDNPEIGSRCHQKRVSFEIAIPGELRREMYRKMAEVGVGRDCLVFGKLIRDTR